MCYAFEYENARCPQAQSADSIRTPQAGCSPQGQGKKDAEISEFVGLSHISTVWQKYPRGGLDAIKPGVRGHHHGEQCRLSAEQETGIRKLLVGKTPEQLKLAFALWNRDAICLAIKHLYGNEYQILRNESKKGSTIAVKRSVSPPCSSAIDSVPDLADGFYLEFVPGFGHVFLT